MTGQPHHKHVFVEEPRPDSFDRCGKRTFSIFCYFDDCYSGPSPISRLLYPPEKIGPKLMPLKRVK